MTRLLQLTIFFLIISTVFSFAQKQGNASYYSHRLKGRHTSDGGKYHPDSMTCAHRTYPLGTILRVRNPKNSKQVFVRVTDRGPHQRRLMIDLSYSAAKKLEIIGAGIALVEVTRLDSMPLSIPTPIYSPLPILRVSKVDVNKTLQPAS